MYIDIKRHPEVPYFFLIINQSFELIAIFRASDFFFAGITIERRPFSKEALALEVSYTPAGSEYFLVKFIFLIL